MHAFDVSITAPNVRIGVTVVIHQPVAFRVKPVVFNLTNVYGQAYERSANETYDDQDEEGWPN